MSSLVDKLLSRLTRMYDRTPGPLLALRLSYTGGQMSWAIAEDVLTTTVVGGVGEDQTVDLTQYTIGTLATYFAGLPGYVVPFLEGSVADFGAVALVEGGGNILESNGDHIYYGTNPNWSLFNAYARELTLARRAIQAAPAEMATTTADGEWLDYLGSYYAVPRELREPDATYGPRIAAEVLLPRQNNVAIELALQQATGQPATCSDALVYGNPLPIFDGSIAFDGTHFFNASASRIYNLFDVVIGYALVSRQSPGEFLDTVRRQIDRLRAAGTHLRNLTLGRSALADQVRPATDALVEVWSETSFFTAVATSADFATASFAGLTARPTSADNATATLKVGLTQTASFAASATLTANPGTRMKASAALPGAGLLTAVGRGPQRASAAFAAAGQFKAGGVPQSASATFAGSGRLTA